MANIQPVATWYQGAEHQANVFNLYSSYDDLINSASFDYQLIELIITPGYDTTVIDENGDTQIVHIAEQQFSQTLINGKLSISGQDYIDWDSSVSANDWIYNWAAQQLNLVIIP